MTVTQLCAGIGCQLKEFVNSCDIDPRDIERFEKTRGLHVSKRGEEVFCQDHPSTGIYCVRSGQVLLSHVDLFEHETAFRVVGPGELLGYRSFFAGDLHTATAQALTTCHICWHPAEVVHHLINHYPLLGRQFLKALAQDRGAPDGLLLRGQQLPLKIRLIHLLLILKDQYAASNGDGSLKFHLPLLRRDIAALLGTRAESIARAIKELRVAGIARFEGRNVTVPNQDRLFELARIHTRAAVDGDLRAYEN